MLFNRGPRADAAVLQHTTLAISRRRFLFVAAKIWRHAWRTGVSYSDQYEEEGMVDDKTLFVTPDLAILPGVALRVTGVDLRNGSVYAESLLK